MGRYVTSAYGFAYTGLMSKRALQAAAREGDNGEVVRHAEEWSRNLCVRSGVPVTIQGGESIDWTKPAVFVCNHQSLLDIPVLISAFDRWVGFLTKKELFRIPLFGEVLRRLGCVSVDRSNLRSAKRSIEVAADKVRKGTHLIVFPEGTRSPDGQLKPFKKGPFYLIEEARVPMIPVAIVGTHQALPKGRLVVRGCAVQVRVGELLQCPDLPAEQAREALRSQAHAAVRALIEG